jgi:hypothetical protein
MARNKLAKQAGRLRAERRDIRRVEPDGVEDKAIVAPVKGPSWQVEVRELAEAVYRRLTRMSGNSSTCETNRSSGPLSRRGWGWNPTPSGKKRCK